MLVLYVFSWKLLFIAIGASLVSLYFLRFFNTLDTTKHERFFIERFGQHNEKEEASRIDTSQARLSQLSDHPNWRVRKLVAQNPNTPTNKFLRLAKEFPSEVSKNPSFALALLEQPDLFARADRYFWTSGDWPREFIGYAIASPYYWIRCEVAGSHNINKSELETLSNDHNCRV